MTYLTMKDVARVSIRPATDDDADLPGYDFTRLNAVSTCPRYGVIRYVHNLAMGISSARNLALEAGSASHDVYAAARLWQVMKTQGLTAHAMHHGPKLMGEYTWEQMSAIIDERESDEHNFVNFCLEAFYQSGYYDDPMDKRRTVANIEEALIAYLHRFDLRRNVWVEDVDRPDARIGVEIPINVVVTFEFAEPNMFGAPHLSFRLIGRADGVSVVDGKLWIEENKTASRLGDAWSLSFETSHQVTGYMLGVTAVLNLPELITNAFVHGMCIPLPRTYDYGGLATERISRSQLQFMQWYEWALNTVQVINQWQDTPLDAPMYTGACNKYYRPCSFIPLCAARTQDEQQQVFDEMVEDEWNPLAEGA